MQLNTQYAAEKKTGRRKSIRRKWLFSYFVVMMIPILCSVCAYFACYRLISEEIRAANTLTLVSAQSAMDSRLTKMKEMTVTILRDKSFREVALLRNQAVQRYWRAGDLREQLANYKASSMNMDIMIYFPALDYMITPDVGYTIDLLSDTLDYLRNFDINAKSWREAICEARSNTFAVSSVLSYDRYGSPSIVYCSDLSSLFQPGCYEAKVFISMRMEDILPNITLHPGSDFLILDPQGHVVFASGSSFEQKRILFDADGGAYQALTIDGAKYAGMFSHSHVDGASLTYVVMTPYNLFWSRSYSINTIMVIGFILASILGIAVSIRLLSINYSPLQLTLNSLPECGDENGNEFDRINHQLSLLYSTQSAMRKNLSRQQQYIKEYYLGLLLQGNAAAMSDDDIIASLEMDLTDKCLVPVFITVDNEDDWAEMHSEYKNADAARKSVSLSGAIENVLAGFLPSGADTLKTRSEDMIIIVCIAAPEMSDAMAGGMEEALEKTCDYFQRKLRMSLHAVIGTQARSMDELPAIYRQVFPLRSLHIIAPQGGRVMAATSYVMPTNPLTDRVDSYLSLLFDAVRLHAVSDAREVLSMLFREMDAATEPATIKRYFLFELAHRLYGSIADADRRYHMSERMECLDRLAQAKSEEIRESFERFILLLCNPTDCIAQESDSCGHARLHLRVQAYVREHYADANLNLAQIAQYVGMSPQYVSKMYKLESGQGLLDFINSVRIARAKEILAEEQIAISDVAPRVGYTNVRTFRRAFQKMEGINPGTYKS